VVHNTSGAGFNFVADTSNSVVDVALVRSVSAHNLTGILQTGGAQTSSISQMTVTGNLIGWSVSNGSELQSHGDNDFTRSNGSNVGVLTPVSKQ
jgi:hypothetical protein